MTKTENYRPLACYFGWVIIAFGLWLLAFVVMSHLGIVVPPQEAVPADYQVARFFLRLLASDFQCGMAVVFIGTLFYAASQVAAAGLDSDIFAAATEHLEKRPTRTRAIVLSLISGRDAGFWRDTAERRRQEGGETVGLDATLTSFKAHIRFGGAATMMPLRFALWLFPMLGFLGTVVGLSFAVNDLAVMVTTDSGSGLKDPKFKDVLSNLHLAFDTTIQGIICAIAIIVIIAGLDQGWQNLLSRVDALEASANKGGDAGAASGV